MHEVNDLEVTKKYFNASVALDMCFVKGEQVKGDNKCFQDILSLGKDGLVLILEEIKLDGASEYQCRHCDWRIPILQEIARRIGLQPAVISTSDLNQLRDYSICKKIKAIILDWGRENDLID